MDVIDTPRFNNDVDFLYRLATVLEMRLRKGMHMAKEQYQQNSKKWQTWQLGFQTLERYWANFQVTRLFHSATNFFNQVLITRMKRVFFFFFFGGGGGGGGIAQLQCIYYLVLYTDLKAAEGI